MSRPLRVLAYAALGLLLCSVVPPLIYPSRSTLTLDFAADVPLRIISGFHPIERTPDGRTTYAWTAESFGLAFPGLDRGARWKLTMRLAASRADGTRPQLVTSINGVGVSRTTLPATGYVTHEVWIEPSAQPTPRTTAVSFRVTPTFVPGGGDLRALGVQVDDVRIAPDRWWVRLGSSLQPALVLGAAAGAVAGALALPAAASVSLLALLALLSGLVLTQGFGAYITLSWRLPLIGAGVAAALSAVALPRATIGSRLVVALSFVVVAIELLVLGHPDMPVGDAVFQAHRFQDVLAGHYYFTSLAPGNYQFPYPIGLYLVSAPFSGLARGELQNAALLRVVVVTVSAAGAALLYRFIWDWLKDDVAAVGAVVAYHLLPLGFNVIATGNLTNMFGQAIAIMVFVVASRSLTAEGYLRLLLYLVLTSLAFLSHTSTFAVLTTQLVLLGLALVVTRDAARRRAGVVLLAATAAAVLLAVVGYYAHFMDVYREAWTRITAETGRATAAAGDRTPLVRLLDVPRVLQLSYGWALIALALAGAIDLVRRRTGAIGRTAVAMWLAAALLFQIIGIITPVDMRHALAALPAVAVLAALGFAWGWRRSGWARLAVGLLAAWASWQAGVSLLAWIARA
jgi:hypothetical protein